MDPLHLGNDNNDGVEDEGNWRVGTYNTVNWKNTHGFNIDFRYDEKQLQDDLQLMMQINPTVTQKLNQVRSHIINHQTFGMRSCIEAVAELVRAMLEEINRKSLVRSMADEVVRSLHRHGQSVLEAVPPWSPLHNLRSPSISCNPTLPKSHTSNPTKDGTHDEAATSILSDQITNTIIRNLSPNIDWLQHLNHNAHNNHNQPNDNLGNVQQNLDEPQGNEQALQQGDDVALNDNQNVVQVEDNAPPEVPDNVQPNDDVPPDDDVPPIDAAPSHDAPSAENIGENGHPQCLKSVPSRKRKLRSRSQQTSKRRKTTKQKESAKPTKRKSLRQQKKNEQVQRKTRSQTCKVKKCTNILKKNSICKSKEKATKSKSSNIGEQEGRKTRSHTETEGCSQARSVNKDKKVKRKTSAARCTDTKLHRDINSDRKLRCRKQNNKQVTKTIKTRSSTRKDKR